jgi:ketosteroid isomerase-like protein
MIFFVQCSYPKTFDISKEKENILKTDREFSDYSEKNGMKKAFELFGDENMVMLRQNSMPVVGKSAFIDLHKNWDDSQTTLVWEPLFADVSMSGDLGYSYGVYSMTSKSNSLKIEKGTYLSIWKKDCNGNWKFVVDTGNEGIGE